MFDRSPSLSHAVPGPPQRAVQQSLGRLSTRVQRQNASEIPSFSAEFHKIAASNSFAKPLARGATDGTNKGPPTVPKLEFTSAVARSSLGIALRDTRQGAVNEGRKRGRERRLPGITLFSRLVEKPDLRLLSTIPP